MNPIRRELLNGLLVLVVASLLSAAFAAFQLSFNVQLFVWIVIGIGIAVSGYVVFEFVLSAEDRELRFMASTENREKEWLKRVGRPARLAINAADEDAIAEAVKDITPGSDYTAMYYVSPAGTISYHPRALLALLALLFTVQFWNS